MRRLIFTILAILLTGLVTARLLLPESAEYAMADYRGAEYNILDSAPPPVTETAGTGLIDELNGYYFSRTPTAKHELTGSLRGKNLILICADSWAPDPTDPRTVPVLRKLWREGAKFSRVYRPDWYQGMDGREFALIAGLVPTRVDDATSLAWAGRQDVCLPFTLARCLGGAGYKTCAYIKEEAHRTFYEAAGFEDILSVPGTAADAVSRALETLPENGPFFSVFIFSDPDCGAALAQLTETLDQRRLTESTVVCLLTGNTEPHTAQIFLWAGGATLRDIQCGNPCSELDVTPTLLNLFGAEYDSRFLSGRDLFAPVMPGRPSDSAPLVSLYGSAWSDWVTEQGSFITADSLFFPDDPHFTGERAVSLYVGDICRLQYDRYIFSRRAMESDYFRLVFRDES